MPSSTVVIIPARFGSTRLPGKALADIAGRPMVCHVAERARRARGIARVIVATDDTRIRDAVTGAGGEAMLTGAQHPTGTDRLAEVARQLEADVLVNVQGDLPLLDPTMVEALADRMAAEPALAMATVATPVRDEADWRSPHVVKVVVDAADHALYFSRSPIPHDRDGSWPAGEPSSCARSSTASLSAWFAGRGPRRSSRWTRRRTWSGRERRSWPTHTREPARELRACLLQIPDARRPGGVALPVWSSTRWAKSPGRQRSAHARADLPGPERAGLALTHPRSDSYSRGP
jgi:3-deoxy-D-manno-octulosonate cytidylyltransferase